jgi:hypothetical protein
VIITTGPSAAAAEAVPSSNFSYMEIPVLDDVHVS